MFWVWNLFVLLIKLVCFTSSVVYTLLLLMLLLLLPLLLFVRRCHKCDVIDAHVDSLSFIQFHEAKAKRFFFWFSRYRFGVWTSGARSYCVYGVAVYLPHSVTLAICHSDAVAIKPWRRFSTRDLCNSPLQHGTIVPWFSGIGFVSFVPISVPVRTKRKEMEENTHFSKSVVRWSYQIFIIQIIVNSQNFHRVKIGITLRDMRLLCIDTNAVLRNSMATTSNLLFNSTSRLLAAIEWKN